MYNPIEEKRKFVQAQIQKSFNSGINVADEMVLEKAHQDGDHHPTKPLVWVSSANGGKGDWRVEGGRTHKKALASRGTSNSVPSFDDYAKKYIEEHFKKHPNSAMTRADLIEDAKDKYNHQYGKISNNAGNSINNGWDDKAGGYKTEPFKGAAKVDSLKAGDKLQTKSGKIYTIKSVNDNANNTVDIVIDNGSKIGGGVFAQTYNKSGYIGATKVDNNTTSKTQSPQDKVKTIMQQFDDTTMDEDEFDEYVDSVLGNDMGQKLRKRILESNKSFSDKRQAYEDAVERHLGLKPQKYSEMDIKDAKKGLVGKVVTLKDYWPDGRGGTQDAIGEIKNVRLYGKDKLPIAQISYPNGDEQMIRLDEIDDGNLKDSYKTPISIGDDKTKLDSVKNKIANGKSDPRDKIAHDAGFKDYEEMRGYQDYVTMKNLLKKPSTKAGMRLLYEKEVWLYEKDHADLIKKILNKKVNDKSTKKNHSSDYSDLTFDEAVKIGESHISAEEKSSIEKEPLRYLQEDAKYHKWDDDVKYQQSRLKESVDMKIGSTDFMSPSKVVTSEYKSKEIKRYADALATAKERENLYKKALANAKAEKKQFLNNTGNDFTENEVRKYINKFRPKDEPNAVVENKWHTFAGRIGNTSATIRVGSGKAKDINDGMPDWRPIGVYSYSTMGWDGKMMTITGTVQSWKEVKDCLSDTENMRISIYKHPKQ